jgi:hypothetical protein
LGDTWVTDMTHFPPPDEVLPESYAPARRLAAYLGSVGAASVASPNEVVETALRCRRRPSRRPCPGYIALRKDGARITWECTACDDNGVISGWRGTHWDLSRRGPRLPVAEAGECRVELTADEYQALRTIWLLDAEQEWILAGARAERR